MVVTLDFDNKKSRVTGYKEDEYHVAFKEYERREHELGDKQTVLIVVNRLKKLRDAYPNYFVDLGTFMNMVSFIVESSEKM